MEPTSVLDWPLGSDADQYYCVRLAPGEVEWRRGPHSDASWQTAESVRQTPAEFAASGAPDEGFRACLARFPQFHSFLIHAIPRLDRSGDLPTRPPHPPRDERQRRARGELVRAADGAFEAVVPFVHYHWIYEPGHRYAETDGNIGPTGLTLADLARTRVHGYFRGEVFVITGFGG